MKKEQLTQKTMKIINDIEQLQKKQEKNETITIPKGHLLLAIIQTTDNTKNTTTTTTYIGNQNSPQLIKTIASLEQMKRTLVHKITEHYLELEKQKKQKT